MRARRYDHRFAEDGMIRSIQQSGRQHYIPRHPDEVCIHPRRAIWWDDDFNVYRCGHCGQIMYQEESA